MPTHPCTIQMFTKVLKRHCAPQQTNVKLVPAEELIHFLVIQFFLHFPRLECVQLFLQPWRVSCRADGGAALGTHWAAVECRGRLTLHMGRGRGCRDPVRLGSRMGGWSVGKGVEGFQRRSAGRELELMGPCGVLQGRL